MSLEEKSINRANYLLEDIFKSGLYPKMKRSKNKLDQLKESIKAHFINGERRRYELTGGLVAKFVQQPIYETDELGLKEFLYDYGVLHKVVTLKFSPSAAEKDDIREIIKELEPFQLPCEYTAQIYIRSLGKSMIDKTQYRFDNLELCHLSRKYKLEKSFEVRAETLYKKKVEAKSLSMVKFLFSRSKFLISSTFFL